MGPAENHIKERQKHPMFTGRANAMEYVGDLTHGSDPAKPEMETKVIEKEVRVPDQQS